MQRRNQTEYGVRKASRRKSQSREPRPRLLIVCEGETEAAYVRGFGISSATIHECVHPPVGAGMDNVRRNFSHGAFENHVQPLDRDREALRDSDRGFGFPI